MLFNQGAWIIGSFSKVNLCSTLKFLEDWNSFLTQNLPVSALSIILSILPYFRGTANDKNSAAAGYYHHHASLWGEWVCATCGIFFDGHKEHNWLHQAILSSFKAKGDGYTCMTFFQSAVKTLYLPVQNAYWSVTTCLGHTNWYLARWVFLG